MKSRYLQSRLLVVTIVAVRVVSKTNFTQCLEKIHQMPNTTVGGTDNQGNPAPIFNTTAITYKLCVDVCGSDPEPASWAVFSQQFSAWLLPWLALISQLPFGANDKFANLQSMLLTVGSPVLAAYSLILTTLNGRWIVRRFLPYKRHPHASRAVRALSRLQQAPLRITDDRQLLSALVQLRQNRQWWDELLSWLNLTHSWSISAATSIAWVFIAYIFTVIDSLTQQVDNMVNANGQGVGSIWLWLLAVVVGWLQISPKCDSIHLDHSLGRANRLAFTSKGRSVAETDVEPAVYLEVEPSTLRCDEGRSPPIFNYARVFAWVRAVEQVADAFGEPVTVVGEAFRTSVPSPASTSQYQEETEMPSTSESNEFLSIPLRPLRESGPDSVADPEGASAVHERIYRRWGDEIWERIFISSSLALFLQWGTTGAALVVVWFTPTKGMGCRSLAYLGYGIISTLVWATMLLSSILSHYSVTSQTQRTVRPTLSGRIAKAASIALRRLGKCLATINGIGLVVVCVLQFSNFFDRCYCNSSVLTLGDKAYNVIVFEDADRDSMRSAWGGGVVLAGVSTVLFYGFVNLFVDPSFPSCEDDNH